MGLICFNFKEKNNHLSFYHLNLYIRIPMDIYRLHQYTLHSVRFIHDILLGIFYVQLKILR